MKIVMTKLISLLFMQVYIKENWGKNVRKDVVELLVQGEPGGFISFSGMDWELYKRNRNLFLNREMVKQHL